jgi:thermitase
MDMNQGRVKKARALGRAAILTVGALVIGTTAKTQLRSPDIETVPGQYVVQLKNQYSFYGVQALESKFKARFVDQVREDIILIERDPSEDRSKVIRELEKSGMVEIAEPNYVFRAIRKPNDPDYSQLWGLSNSGGADKDGSRGMVGMDIGAEKAWDITTGKKDVIVAVIDTGVDFSHPELANNAWINEAEARGETGVDDDGNGYIDDINGFNFVANNGNSNDDNGHGTHCAGTIGAEGDNGIGIVGVAWNVRIMAVKFLDRAGGGTLDGAIKAVDYARKNGAHISSNSWGGGGISALLKKAVEDTRDAGQIFVAAAGNSAMDNDRFATQPAGLGVENIISVAALDNRGEMASFSNYGAQSVHVAAPGVNILSTVPGGAYDTYSGTSMATPHVSGVVALMLSQNPNMTYQEVKQRLISSSRGISTLSGRVVSGGIVDAYYALTGKTPPPDPNDPSRWTESLPQNISTPHPYPAHFEDTYTITVPGASRLSVHFSRFETERGYDKLEFFNKNGDKIGSWSGKNSGRYSPIVDGDTIIMKFKADHAIEDYGFDVDKVMFER